MQRDRALKRNLRDHNPTEPAQVMVEGAKNVGAGKSKAGTWWRIAGRVQYVPGLAGQISN